MIRSLNTASLGIRQFQSSLDVLANNLANLNTVGYKGSRTDFVESLNTVLRAPTPDTATGSGTSGVSVGNGVTTSTIRSNFSQGSVNQTGMATDFSVTGNGYFLVRNSTSGEVFATRSGNFRLDSTGYLVTDGGMRVQGVEDFQKDPNKIGDIRFDKGTLPSTAPTSAATASITSMSVDGAGRLNTLLDDGTQYVRGQLVLQTFSNEQAMVRAGNNLFTNLGGAGAAAPGTTGAFTSTPNSAVLNGARKASQDGMGRIEQGALELSNVDVSREFSNMITTQRAFQANARMITTSDSIIEELVNLKR
jgi:flagellar hook protein FlgE